MDESLFVWILKVILDFVWTIALVFYGIIESWVRFFYTPRKDLQNEIVVLTGAAGGFGTLIAEKMTKKGCKMVLLDINDQELQKLAEKLNGSCGSQNAAFAYQCDITSEDEIEKVTRRIVDDVGHPTMLINNAGVVAGRYFKTLQQKDVVKTFSVNILSHYMLVRKFLPHMLEENHGHIVCIASILAIKSLAGVSEYAPSKAAAVSYMDALRQEISVLGKGGVHCTTVLPYQVSTELFTGCNIRFKSLPTLNVLTPEYVTDKIVDAIEKNQISLYMPRSCYLLCALLGILPHRSIDALFDFLGANRAMESYVGRGKKQS